MKVQDIVFFLIVIVVCVFKGKGAWHVGIGTFALAGVLFLVGNLFTAQRFSWYAAGFLGIAVIQKIVSKNT